ncbi:hypothetical protein F4678DRAFT_452059 [Xylaria arbuscula]|nr:hypothetical protein F4678DRAFT_452059 [Xylaria arbuscula]
MIQRFSVAPFATIASFILIPASKRLPFISGVSLLWNTFLFALLYRLLPWIVQLEPMQEGLRNMTNELKAMPAGGIHTIDEL